MTTPSSIICLDAGNIVFSTGSVEKMTLYTPSGQTPNQPTGLQIPQKLQIVTGENSVSINGSKAIQAGQQNGTGLYVKTPYDAGEALFTQVCVQPSSANCQNLTMSSGQVSVPVLGMTQYSTLCNGAGGVQNNLQISAALPNQGDQTLNFYSNSYAASIGAGLKAQFTDKVGYSQNIDITDDQQFTSKIYVDTQAGSGISLATAKANFIALDGTQTALITAPIPMNNQKITGLGNATSNLDGLNRQTGDGRYYLNTTVLNSIQPPTGSLSLNSKNITNLLDPTTAQMAATKAYVDAKPTFKTANIVIGTLQTTNGTTNVTSFTGFITSATKSKNGLLTPGGNIITVNYSNLGFTPMFLCTPIASVTGDPTLNSTGINITQFTATPTQATFLFVCSAGNPAGTTTLSMNLMVANSLVL